MKNCVYKWTAGSTLGNGLLRQFGLQKITYPSEEIFLSRDWKLDFDGKLYGKRE